MYKEDLALNNLQGLICHKTQPNQTNSYVNNYSAPSSKQIDSSFYVLQNLLWYYISFLQDINHFSCILHLTDFLAIKKWRSHYFQDHIVLELMQ